MGWASAGGYFNAVADALIDGDDDVFGEGLSWGTLPDWMTDEGAGRMLWAYGAGGGDD